MRILIQSINFSPEPTSTGKYTGEMAEWLAMRGHEIRVVTAPPHYPPWRVFDGYSSWRFSREEPTLASDSAGRLEVLRCPIWIPSVPRGWKRILYLVSHSLSSWPAMLRQISWRPDVVLLVEPTLFCSPQALCVARMSGAVAWLHVQDLEIDVAFQLKDFSSIHLRKWVHAMERFLLKRFDRTSAISERIVERLLTKGAKPDGTTLFPNWVDTSTIFPSPARNLLRQELGIPENATVALYSGNMGLKQGLSILMDASRHIAARHDIQFVLCGDGPYREILSRFADEVRNVKLIPLQPAERLNELLNLADIHLLPQLADAADLVMPSKLTGIMASGRPVVATARPGTQLSGLVEGRGIVTFPGNAEAFATAIVRLAEDPKLRDQLGKSARQYALDHMGRDEILTRFEQSLRKGCGHCLVDATTELSQNQNGKLPAI